MQAFCQGFQPLYVRGFYAPLQKRLPPAPNPNPFRTEPIRCTIRASTIPWLRMKPTTPPFLLVGQRVKQLGSPEMRDGASEPWSAERRGSDDWSF